MNVLEIKDIEKRLADLDKLKGLTINNLPDFYKQDVALLLRIVYALRNTVAQLSQIRDAKEGVIPHPREAYYPAVDQGISKLLRGDFQKKPIIN